MTPSMPFHDLLEMAVLDTLGLLDEQEQAAFEMAFRSAPPAVQAQVRREQTRFAKIDHLLPQVEPPAGLRAAVLERLRREFAQAEQSQVASILPMARSRGVSPLWRAAALGLLAASVTFGVLTFQLVHQAERTAKQIRSDALLAELGREFGSGFVRDVLFAKDTSRIVLAAERSDFVGQASLFVNPEWRQAKFFHASMPTPEGQTLRLAILDDQGRVVRVLREFTSAGGVESLDIDLQPGVSGQIAVLTGASAGPVVLCRAPLTGRI